MRLLFELSQEHPELAKSETLACLEAEVEEYNILNDDQKNILRIEVPPGNTNNFIQKLPQRIALCHSITLELFSDQDLANVLSFVKNLDLNPTDTFCVTAKRVGNANCAVDLPDLESKVGKILAQQNQVNLESPDIEIKILVSTEFYTGITIADIDRTSFEARKPQNRPYFSPVSIHPKFARALVNLSRLKAGDILLDPFCGTGGIMIEAGLIGVEIIGCDLDKNMVKGCRENLVWAGLANYSLYQSDIGELGRVFKKRTTVDAIVTEPPYGRAATTGGEVLITLYERAFKSFCEILPKGKYLIISLPGLEFIEIGKKYFELQDLFSMRIHRSLDKHFCVFKNNV